ncbi:unnamed protein product [Amoebophrya sp. A120]|nr:unnamed protein product [Amoebophrya sp. A120]|eukprot:GSA120T00019429001.1
MTRLFSSPSCAIRAGPAFFLTVLLLFSSDSGTSVRSVRMVINGPVGGQARDFLQPPGNPPPQQQDMGDAALRGELQQQFSTPGGSTTSGDLHRGRTTILRPMTVTDTSSSELFNQNSCCLLFKSDVTDCIPDQRATWLQTLGIEPDTDIAFGPDHEGNERGCQMAKACMAQAFRFAPTLSAGTFCVAAMCHSDQAYGAATAVLYPSLVLSSLSGAMSFYTACACCSLRCVYYQCLQIQPDQRVVVSEADCVCCEGLCVLKSGHCLPRLQRAIEIPLYGRRPVPLLTRSDIHRSDIHVGARSASLSPATDWSTPFPPFLSPRDGGP